MSIKRLEINGVRILRETRLENCQRINILSGENGSGKTSVLEAIYLLGMGRSFRGNHLAPVINNQMEACSVYGELSSLKSACATSLGVWRSRYEKQEFHVNKQPVSSAAALARALPLLLINAEVFELILGGPKVRRQFMDLGVFHVKPGFLDTWRNFQRCLRQRNSLLREHKMHRRGKAYSPEIAAWDGELVRLSTEIDTFRDGYIANIAPVFDEILQQFGRLPNLILRYQRGWGNGATLQAALEGAFERDIAMGTTTVGPHRANIDIRAGGGALAADTLSRGQLKLVSASLKLAQGRLLAAQSEHDCIFLVDDLSAELDREHQASLCKLLDETGGQIFITGVDADAIGDYWQNTQAIQKFHVKQGAVE